MNRLSRIGSLDELQEDARRILPHSIFAYASFAAETGQSAQRNQDSFRQWSFETRVLKDVSGRALDVELFGHRYAMPFGIAPMGAVCLAHRQGDLALAQAATHANVPFVLSGASTVRMEEIVRANPAAWFQAYLPPARDRIIALVDRVAAAGFQTLVVTVDVPVPSNRQQLDRAGFSTPLRPSWKLLMDGLLHPRWLAGVAAQTILRDGVPYLENMAAVRGPPILHGKAIRSHNRDTLTWEDVRFIRDRWKGALVIKGILSADDARTAGQIGADGLVVSNHGGRQLDAAMSPLDALPDIVTAAPGLTILLDGGVRRGTDVLKAMALGVHAVLAGRPFFYALAIAGEAAALRVTEIMRDELRTDLALLGCTDFSELPSRLRSTSARNRT
jgi:L-lactate dehydrogenase (cytochrome)